MKQPETDEFERRHFEFNPTAQPWTKLHPAAWFPNRAITKDEQQRVVPWGTAGTLGDCSASISAHMASTCAGWVQIPRSQEFYAAIRAERPTERQRDILLQWTEEALPSAVFDAWAEGVYTIRELVGALERAGITTCRLARMINEFADPPRETTDDERAGTAHAA